MSYNDLTKNISYLKELCDYFKNKLAESVDGVVFNSVNSINVVSVSFPGIRGEVLLHTLEEKNIYVSTGSACNSKSTKISYVLDAMGLDKKTAEGRIRVSFSALNTKQEIDNATIAIADAVKFLRKFTRR